MLKRSFRVLALSLACVISHTAAAQDTNRIIAESAGNRFLSTYQIIEDDPLCSRSDQLAYRVPLVGERLEYSFYDPVTRASAFVSDNSIVTGHECFVTQGFGVDRRRIAIPCGEDRVDPIRDLVRSLDIAVSVEAEVTICLSPTSSEIVAQRWGVLIKQGDAVFAYGNPSQQGDETTVGPVRMTPIADFRFYAGGFDKDAWPWQHRKHPLVQQFGGTNAIRMDVNCVPLRTGDQPPLFLGFRATFAVTDGSIRTCIGTDCPSFSRPSLRTRLPTSIACSGF